MGLGDISQEWGTPRRISAGRARLWEVPTPKPSPEKVRLPSYALCSEVFHILWE